MASVQFQQKEAQDQLSVLCNAYLEALSSYSEVFQTLFDTKDKVTESDKTVFESAYNEYMAHSTNMKILSDELAQLPTMDELDKEIYMGVGAELITLAGDFLSQLPARLHATTVGANLPAPAPYTRADLAA